MFTQNGDYIGGFLTPAELVQAVQESQKGATGLLALTRAAHRRVTAAVH